MNEDQKPRPATTNEGFGPPIDSKLALRAKHVLPFLTVLMCVLFFQGCQTTSIRLTTGPLAPILRLEYVDDAPLESKVSHFAPHWLVLNVVAFVVVFIWVPTYSRRFRQLLRSWEFYWSLYLAAIIFNSILFWGAMWLLLVYRPTYTMAVNIVQLFEEPRSTSVEQFILGFSARAYFLFVWIVAFGVLRTIKIGFRRYAMTDPERWWQFNLRGLLALTFIVGTGLGLALRLINR